MDPLNIVVICLDTFRADIVGPGHKLSHVKTPNLDQLAAESVRFTRCFGEAQATLQVRNGCFTGMRFFPSILGYYGWHEIPDEYPTVAETLVRNGYSTGLIGDTPHMFKPNMNFSRGFLTFEHIRGQTSDSWKAGSWDLVKELFKDYFGEYVPKVPQHSGSTLYSEGQVLQYLHNVRDRTEEADWFAPRVFSSACRWVEDNARNRPFFLWLDCFRDPRNLRSSGELHPALQFVLDRAEVPAAKAHSQSVAGLRHQRRTPLPVCRKSSWTTTSRATWPR